MALRALVRSEGAEPTVRNDRPYPCAPAARLVRAQMRFSPPVTRDGPRSLSVGDVADPAHSHRARTATR
jgi:hypothetical protein